MNDQHLNDWSIEEAGPIDRHLAINTLARRLPRAELHSHLAGALHPAQVRELGHGQETHQWGATHDYGGVDHFFSHLMDFAAAFDDAGAVRDATLLVLRSAVDSGCRHVELAVNHSEFDTGGLGLDGVLDAASGAFAQARRLWGLSGGLILAADRGIDPSHGHLAVAAAVAARDRGVPMLGIGNDGVPLSPLTAFAPVYDAARSAGFRTTAHANKPVDVVDVLTLGLDRIDHAWELQGQPHLQAQVRSAGTPVTMALTSCLMMLPGRFPTADSFTFEELRRAGLRVSLNVDDGALFATDSAQEYAFAARTWDWSPQVLGDVAYASLAAAWIDDDREARLAHWRREIDALVADPRMPDRTSIGADPAIRS
ncbi:MAG: adenosine deaminase [Microbacterium sp.]|jgi:adenosine deaminase|nr:adenosine deaminase [Microbacterium sp.]